MLRIKIPLHPFLLAIFPILFLYVHNAAETPLTELAVPLITVSCLVLGGLFFLRLLISDQLKRALILSASVLLFFSYGHLVHLLREFQVTIFAVSIGPQSVVLIVGSLFLLWGIYSILRTRRNLQQLTTALNLIALLLVAAQVFQGVVILTTRQTNAAELALVSPNQRYRGPKPDIYYIILDGYAREDVLEGLYNYDNSSFLNYLRERGFQVADSSRSNYCQTLLSLASTLNMDYLQNLRSFDEKSSNRQPLIELLQHNTVFDFLRRQGYTLIAFSSGLTYTELENVDVRLTTGKTLSEFQNILLASTPLPLLLRLGKTQYDMHRDRLNFIINKLPHVREGRSPRFVFAHLIAPHPPFVVGAGGEPVARARRFNFTDGSDYFGEGGTTDDYRNGYLNQITYLNDRFRVVLDTLLANHQNNPPIIILQADHGPGLQLHWGSLQRTNIKERFSIFNAIYLPGATGVSLEESITSVNTFRFVFDLYFGTNYGSLPNEHYYSWIAKPYLFMRVTKLTDSAQTQQKLPARLDRRR